MPDPALQRHIDACNNIGSPAGLIPFRIGAAQVGWVSADLAQALTFRPRDFHFDRDGVAIAARLRSPGQPAGPVVVGIDGTSRSSAALAGAVKLAGMLGTTLQVVHIDQSRGGAREGHGRHGPLHGQELLDRTLEEARHLAPELSISGVLQIGRASCRERVL